MKKIVALLLSLFLLVGPLLADDNMITISESDLTTIIEEEVRKAVSEAVSKATLKIVQEYELKLIDKNIEITNLKADVQLEVAEKEKYIGLYNLEIAKNQRMTFTLTLIGIGAGVLGLGLGFGISQIGR